MAQVSASRSVRFFDRQFRHQIEKKDFSLNPFEELALGHLSGSILDLGCGLGNLSIEAARRGHRVEAVDASPAAVSHINNLALARSLPLQAHLEDLDCWNIEGRFDTIVSIGLLMFLRRARALDLLQQILDQVQAGGCVAVNLLVEGTTYLEMFEPGHYTLFGADELERHFHGWTILERCRQIFPAPGETQKHFLTLIATKPGQGQG